MADGKITDDNFFSLLADELDQGKNQSDIIEMTDEVLFRDEQGNLMMLKNGKIMPVDGVKQNQVEDALAEALTEKSMPEKTLLPIVAKKSQFTEQALKEKVMTALYGQNVKIPLLPVGEPISVSVEVENIIKKIGIKFSDDFLAKRFSNLLTLRLKDIRDGLETKELMLDSVAEGGMGFSKEQVESISKIINAEYEKFTLSWRDRINKEHLSGLESEITNLSQQASALRIKELAESSEPENTPSIEPEPKQEPIPEKIVKTEIPAPIPPKPKVFVPAPKPVEQSLALKTKATVKERGLFDFGKKDIPVKPATEPVIEPVKFEPQLTDPIQEIGTMSLVDFRRLAPNPKAAAEKLLEKIRLLEKTSFGKMIQAQEAWKKSDVYQLYLDLGSESMEQKKSLDSVIEERLAKGIDTLTPEELEAVLDLNKKLRQ